MTDTPDPIGELIELLRAGPIRDGEGPEGIELFDIENTHESMHEASDALESLQGQVRELETENGELKYSDEIQRTTIATLRDALESICDTTRTLTAVRALEFQEIAKAALNPPTREALAREPNTETQRKRAHD